MRISVCMATHNGERFIRQQMDSILNQLGGNDELIISDDHSSDDTLAILHSYADPRIVILSQSKLGSPGKNFERALSHCHHPFIFLADQDDFWHNDKISVMSKALLQSDLVVCDCRIVDQDLNPVFNSFFRLNRSSPGLFRNVIKNSFMGCCMALRKEVLDKALPFPEQPVLYDQWLGLVAERYFTVSFIPDVLVDHRRHQSNFSTTATKSKSSLSQKIAGRIHLAKKLLA